MVKNVPFIVEVCFVTGTNDHNLWCDFVSGLPMHGWARPLFDLESEAVSPAWH